MLGGVIVFIGCFLLTIGLLALLKNAYPWLQDKMLRLLFFYHYLLWLAYYLYTRTNPSDSYAYYRSITNGADGKAWFEYFGSSTTFISFLAYPFTVYMNFSYEAQMVLFAFFGYLGFVFFYIFLKEHVRLSHYFLGIPLVTFLLFLPNNHFWSVSLGKGSVIFFGLGLFFYSLGNLRTRFFLAATGALIIYFVRPHILFVILIGLAVGLFSTTKNVNVIIRSIAIFSTVGLIFLLYDQILAFTGLEEDFFDQAASLSDRASDLTKASSGVDIQSYSIPFKLFTFWFRPLFFDAPGILGIIVSFENFIYLMILFNFLKLDFIRFLWKGDFLVKTSVITILLGSYPLAHIAGNLGLAIRQKSMFMLILFFLVLYYLDQKKLNGIREYLEYLRNRKKKNAHG